LQNLRDAHLGHELLGIEIDACRLDALAMLSRRTMPSGTAARVRRPQAAQPWIAARCSVMISGVSGRSKTCRLSSPIFESANSRA